VLRASLTEAAVGFTHIELVAQGTVDDVDEVGGEAGEGGADGEMFGGASESGNVLTIWFPNGLNDLIMLFLMTSN
jgi:hypothetical protein